MVGSSYVFLQKPRTKPRVRFNTESAFETPSSDEPSQAGTGEPAGAASPEANNRNGGCTVSDFMRVGPSGLLQGLQSASLASKDDR